MAVWFCFQKERKGYWRSHSFATVFNDMFNLSPTTDKILNFRDATNQEICKRLEIRKPLLLKREPMYKNEHKLDWSCQPRSKPLAFIESVHDLPRIKVSRSLSDGHGRARDSSLDG